MAKVAIVGPGAIGGVTAGALASCRRHELTLAARTGFDRLVVETPQGTHECHPRVITELDQAHVVDWVLIATKAYDAHAAARWLDVLCDARTSIAVLQNGVEHVERFAPFVAAERILPVMVDCPAERSAPGRVRQRGAARMVVPESPRGAAFVDLFSGTSIHVAQSAGFQTVLWRKLCLNSAGALSAIAQMPAGIVRHDGIAEAMRGVIRECIAVGRAEGAELDDAIVEEIIQSCRNAPADSINSLHADRIAGRRMEIDARNGVIVRLGRKHGIPTPLNAMIVALLEIGSQSSSASASALPAR